MTLNDLHVHSNESDGQYTPEMLIDAAIESGVSIIALCDHDTTAGAKRFVQYGLSCGIKALAGIELSAMWKGGNCHILGLAVNTDDTRLELILQKTRESRSKRNELILEKLSLLGIGITAKQLLDEAGGEVVARPHIAAALVRAGHVRSTQEAFNKYLSNDAPAYIDRYRLEPAGAVKLLRDAGAFVSLAHPRQLGLNYSELFDFMAELKKSGLQGIEIYAPDTTDEQVETYREMAAAIGLTPTGGSDFHTTTPNNRKLGYYRTGVPVPALSIPELGI